MKGKSAKILKRIAVAGVAIVIVLVVAGGGGWLWLRGRMLASLPVLDGEIAVAGLSAPVIVERDSLGVPTLTGRDRLDLHRAIGFVHGQERFFQMDLLRRKAAGELAELVGAAALPLDRRVRVHRFRTRAERNLAMWPPDELAMLTVYAEGVNAGLAALGTKPPEYYALMSEPRAWAPEDSVLVVLSMYIELQGHLWRRESHRGVLHEALPRELVDFLNPPGTEWDAAIDGSTIDSPPLPSAEVYDLRTIEAVARTGPRTGPARIEILGSNNWAVAGSHTTDGGALLANDMHLPLALPNIWYRACFIIENDAGSVESRLVGVTLPGAPIVVAGSDGIIAWGFTNSYGDWADLVVIERDPDDPGSYLTLDGARSFEHHVETIRVKNEDDVSLEVLETIWGPVIDEDHRGRPRALRWIAHEPAATDGLIPLKDARTVDQALEAVARAGIPAQNFVVVDRDGHIGWTVAGPLPRRGSGGEPVPVPWDEAGGAWTDWLAPEEYPRVTDPLSGRLWTANNRVVGPPLDRGLGDANPVLGARARQIRDGLMSREKVSAEDLLTIQLDDRALFLERWSMLLLDLLDDAAVSGNERRAELARLVAQDWDGTASVDSVGYRMVRGFRVFLAGQVFDAITAPCRGLDENFDFQSTTFQWEGPLWRLVTERPAHLLDPRFENWEEQLLAAVDEMLDYFTDAGATPLSSRTWGRRNNVRVRHPLSLAVPQLSRWLDAPTRALPGDSNMPRVQGPAFGASQRMVVSPGREEQGIFHMPGGQSGHPWSPYYVKGHRAWARGEPTPLLPGPPQHRLSLAAPG